MHAAHRRPPALLVFALLAGACVSPGRLRADVDQASKLVEQARKIHAATCAPVAFADAEAHVAFARVELAQGNARRASDHARFALDRARVAIAGSEGCGGTDRDGDGIADVVDACPDEAEDFDGDRDEDGCRDRDPYGDDDRDGIRNIDDACPDEREDFDGDADDDGCPETSEDRDGDGVVDAADQCPDEPEDIDGFKDHDGCPDPDNDADGIPDRRDACPNAPEDLDGWNDEDGCPDDDNDGDGVHDLDDNCPDHRGPASNRGCPVEDRDGDGVPDAVDQCPDEPETHNRWLDEDGCPDQASVRVRIAPDRLELIEPVAFVGDTAHIASASIPVLEDVARALRELPGVRVRIEGHTEGTGDEEANLVLSRRRAEAVFDWLTAHGLPAERFDIVGYGGTRPVDTNRTSAGRERNRRIEFWFVRD